MSVVYITKTLPGNVVNVMMIGNIGEVDKMVKLVYVIGPYSGNISQNIENAERVSITLIRQVYHVITPHKNTAGYEKYEDDTITYETWIKMDIDIMRRCDAVFIMKGWQQSFGSVYEVDMAKKYGMERIYEGGIRE